MEKYGDIGIDELANSFYLIEEDAKFWKTKFIDTESLKFRKTLKEYKNFITLASQIVKELSLPKNEISMSLVINRLISLGYFSYDDTFCRGNKKEIIHSKLGVSVVLGKGCCRNVSYFTQDIFKKLNIDRETYFCSHDNKSINGEANHVVNVIKYKDNYYLYDVFNDFFLCFTTPNCAVDIENEDNKFYYKPKFLATYESLSFDDIVSNLNKYGSSINNHITLSEYKDINSDTTSNIIRQSRLLKEFKEESKELKLKIKNSI